MSKFNYINNKKREEYVAKLACEFLRNRMPEIGQFDSMASPLDDMCKKFDFYTKITEEKDPDDIFNFERRFKIQLKVRSFKFMDYKDIITRLTTTGKTWISEVNSGEADYVLECFLDTEDPEFAWRGSSIVGIYVLNIKDIKEKFTIVPYLPVDSLFLGNAFKACLYPTSRFGSIDNDILLIPVKSFGKDSYGLKFEKDMINEYCPNSFKSFKLSEE